MGEITFTEEQLAAIDARGTDLLVSAAAGSGKTAVLAERIVRLVTEDENPRDIDRILVVTFTRAAAAGMRERIAAALSARVQADPMNARLRRQEMLLPHAKIITIDAFCQNLLRNSFETVDLDPSFRVIDEGEGKLLVAETLEEILEEAYGQAEEGKLPEFHNCVETFAQGTTDQGLETELLRLWRFSESMPWPALWLREQLREDEAHEDGREPLWVTDVIKRVHRELEGAMEDLKRALEIACSPGGPWMYAETITNDINNLDHVAKAADFSLLGQILQSGGLFGRLSGKRDDSVLTKKKEAVRETRDAVKGCLKRMTERYFSASREELSLREERARRAVCELVRLVLVFRERLAQKKRERRVIDFSDMEHLALRVLTKEPESLQTAFSPVPTATAREYADFFQEIMIDEYQDSNYVQELILRAISGEGQGKRNRFMVGDVKQSIYRFRLARPELFTQKYRSFVRNSEEAALCGERLIDLHRNFRSRSEVLELVNDLFSGIMLSDVGGVDYDEDAMLRAGMRYPDLSDISDRVNGTSARGEDFLPELLLVAPEETGPADQEDDAEASIADSFDPSGTGSDWLQSDPDPAAPASPGGGETQDTLLSGAALSREQAEARLVADRICALMKNGCVSDGAGGLRPVRYGDIVILLRTTSGIDEIYRDVLTEYGIPAHTESKSGYFRAREVKALTDLLAVLENPLRDIPLAGVLKSPLGGFSDEELAEIRGADRKRAHCFFEAFTLYAGNGRGADSGHAALDVGDGGVSSAAVPASEQLADKCRSFLRRLSIWREMVGRLSVRELLETILEETDYLEIVSALPAGEKRRANVRMLLVRAGDFERTGGHGLSAFASRIEQYRLSDVDFGEAAALSEEADLVRIMSIHKSKGLEFPIVFVSGLSRRFNRQDERAAILADEALGIGAFAVDPEARVKYSTAKRFVIADRLHEESLGEEYRVLYVAMTRAREKLILTAYVRRSAGDALLEDLREKGAVSVGEEEIRIHDTAVRESMEQEVCDKKRDRPPVPYLTRAHAGSYLAILSAALKDCCAPIRVRLTAPPMPDGDSSDRVTRIRDRRSALLEAASGLNIDSYLKNQMLKKLTYQYTHPELARLFVKTTVTELKERLLEEENFPGNNRLYQSTEETAIIPGFLREREMLRGAARGTLYHKVMELLDAEILGLDGISNHELILQNQELLHNWIKSRENGRLPGGAAEIIQADDVLTFLSSALGCRFVNAFRRGVLYREKQFMLEMDARRVDPAYPAGETVLLQGVIDAWFLEDEEAVILDYKTDRILDRPEELADKYGIQLALYAEALSHILHRQVKELWIWSFTAGVAVPVTVKV